MPESPLTQKEVDRVSEVMKVLGVTSRDVQNSTKNEVRKVNTLKRARSEYAKSLAVTFEKGNTKYLVAFRSTGNKFWKFCGNSAEFYAFKVGREIGKSPNLRRDGDFYNKTMYTCSIKNIEELTRLLEANGYVKQENLSIPELLVVFLMPTEITNEERIGMRKEFFDKQKEMEGQLSPNWLNKDLYTRIRRMLEITTQKKLNEKSVSTRIIAVPMTECLMRMKIYYVMASEREELRLEMLKKIELEIYELRARMLTAVDMRAWPMRTMSTFVGCLGDFEKVLKKEIRNNESDGAED